MRKLTLCVACTMTLISGHAGAQTAELPMPCVAGVCGANVPGFVTSGRANATISNNLLRVQQQTDRAILNWASFNVGPDGRVVFEQPNSSSIALNRIFQGSPSRIMGAIEANGQIYLVNQNGFLFGPTARVRTAGLIASSLAIRDEVFENGLLSPELLRDVRPALQSDGRVDVLNPDGTLYRDENGQTVKVKITIDPGARISTIGSGQRVMIASQSVDNAGEISAPDGQVILAAGQKVYLQASTDPAMRGLLVEVDAGGDAWNRMTGNISAARGNVTMLGLAVNQQGRVSATSTVNANGSIRLLARDTVTTTEVDGQKLFVSTHGGSLELGATSRTTVTPEAGDTATAVDEQEQMPSKVELHGQSIYLRSGAEVIAPGGQIRIDALNDASRPLELDPGSRVRVESGVRVDASGSTATAPVSRNVVRVELRGNEFRDSPLQRDGELRGQAVYVDARVGTPLGDVSGALANIGRGIEERTSTGGTIALNSAGDIVVSQGAVFDVSGGQVNYTAGAVQTTQLLTADGRAVDIGQAKPDQIYTGLINPQSTRRFDRWGVVETVQGPLIGRYDPGYVEGKSAGTLSFNAPSLALSGNFVGGVVAGPHQRDAAKAPQGGRFIVGYPEGAADALPDYRAPSINFTHTPTPISVGDTGSLPRRPLDLSPDFMTLGGFTRTELYSNGVVTIPESVQLALAPGSSLRITAHRIESHGDISAPAGSVRFASVLTAGIDNAVLPRAGVLIGENSTFDVRGRWNNELSLLTPIYRDGGEIDFSARAPQGELVVGDGTRLLADGGASMSAAGTVTGGRGGRIGLRAGADQGAIEIGEGVQLSAHGVAGARGGSFTLEAPRIEIVSGAQWSEAQRVDLLEPDSGFATIGNSLFTGHGFASFDLAATGPRLQAPEAPMEVFAVREGVSILAQARTLELTGELASRTSGGPVEAFARSLLLPGFARTATSVSLRVDPREFGGADRLGGLVVESGSSIRTEARGTVSLSSPGGMTVAGTIFAPGGAVNMNVPVPGENRDAGYREDLGITVKSGARLDVAGISLLRPNDAGLLNGEVLAGGSIHLDADRGFVSVEQGASLDISGASQLLDISSGTASGYQRRTIGSDGGSISVLARESLTFQGALRAHAGPGDTQSAAGSVSLALTRRGFTPGGSPDTFPSTPRTLLVVPDANGVTLGRNGIGVVDTSLLRASGADALSIEADGRIEFYAGADLSLGRSLQLQAPLIGVSGEQVNLRAPLVSVGYTPLAGAVTSVPGAARLSVTGELIELIGHTTLSGISSARFEADRELRLRGAEINGTNTGSLTLAADLTLAAPVIYPATLTQFSIVAAGGANDAVRFESTGSSSAVPLSVGGQLDVSARTITQDSRLIAPFGSIRLEASGALDLRPGSVTSVSASGSLLPFGRVQLENQWLYELAGALTRPDLSGGGIALSGGEVTLAPNAMVDLGGGGDLYAYEWQPGTGGSRDALRAGETPGLYAILPQLRGGFAPFDPQEYAGSDLKPGDSVYLSGIPGLEAGVYPLLPARYALLPGAMLVSAVPGTIDALPGVDSRLGDGTPVVAGYRTIGGTDLRDSRFSGFAVRPGEYGRRLAQYQDSLASKFDTETRPVAPADAASLSLYATRAFNLGGNVKSDAARGGRGASIDISAPNLFIAGASAAAPEGAVRVDAALLQGWHAESLLLGGKRDGNEITVSAEEVTLGAGAELHGPELVAVALDELSFEAGSAFTSEGTLPPAIDEDENTGLHFGADSAGAAIVMLSGLRESAITRAATAQAPAEEPPAGASVSVTAGARLGSRGSLLIDGPRRVGLDGSIDGLGASWSLGSSTITFGGEQLDSGLTLGNAMQNSLQQARNLRLTAQQGFDFADSVVLGNRVEELYSFDSLVLDTPTWRPVNGGVSATFTAHDITLLGGSQPASPTPPAETPAGSPRGETLSLLAHGFTLGPGHVGVEGFDTVNLDARQEIVGAGRAGFSTTGNLRLTATNIGTASGADLSIMAGGTLTTTRSEPALADASRVSRELGGSVVFAANRIEHGGMLRISSGRVAFDAQESLALAAGSIIDTSGVLVSAAGRSLGSAGGTVDLVSGGTLIGASGATVRASGAGDADAGYVTLESAGLADLRNTFAASAVSGARGGEFQLSAGSIANLGLINTSLEQGGFSERRSFIAATGDLTLAAGQTITARHVELAANGGTLTIGGTINAASDNARGSIDLFGAHGLELRAGARLSAPGTGEMGRGGSARLATGGTLNLANASVIALGGARENGELILRAPATGNGLQLGAFGSSISGVDEIVVQPVLQYTLVANPNAARFTQIRNAVTSFANVAAPALAARFEGNPIPVRMRPGVEMRAEGNLTLPTLDLTTWRFAGQPGDLSFIAGGALNINGTISDGFQLLRTANRSEYLALTTEPSSALHFAAAGNITFGRNARVRTGTGDLSFDAGVDLVFEQGASAYTGGLPAEDTHFFTGVDTLQLPTRGGQLSLNAGNDIRGNGMRQSVGSWQVRQGDTFANSSEPAWGTDLQRFGWNAGTLGGGDVSVRAGQNIFDLSVAAADSASLAGGELRHLPGGVIDMVAGRDIGSVYTHMTAGRNRVRAGGEIGLSPHSTSGLNSVFSMQDVRLDLVARRGVAIEGAFNPTVLTQFQTADAFDSFFFTYSESSALQAQTATGPLRYTFNADRMRQFLGGGNDDPLLWSMLPPNVRLAALDGDLLFEGAMNVFASDHGQLDLFASKDVRAVDSSASVLMSDAPAAVLPTALNQAEAVDFAEILGRNAASARHFMDDSPVRVNAGRDIDTLSLFVPKFAQISAGRDIRTMTLLGQNVRTGDATLITAGRDIIYPISDGLIEWGGPGRLDLLALRNVDLGFSAGITTVGRTSNPALSSDEGADITVLAGLGRDLDVPTFIDEIISPSAQQRESFIDFVADKLDGVRSSFDDALAAFNDLAADVQREFAIGAFFEELVKSGREANTPEGDFERGYAAIDALFPGSRSKDANPYDGDLKLAFSRIYTVADADISLLVPGGLINVGLAVPPQGIGTREPSQLGIVAQRAGSVRIFANEDVLVNASRIFTLRGGDIAIWSTIGDIDAGRGAKSAISAPPPTVLVDPTGRVTLDFAGAVAGSGIRAIITDDEVKPGDVDLMAPAGTVDAGDAGIGSAGNLNVAAQQVAGLDNFNAGGDTTGVPAETSNLGAALAGASAVASSATSAAGDTAETNDASQAAAPLASSAFGFLEVFLEGFGSEVCKADDTACLQRNQK